MSSSIRHLVVLGCALVGCLAMDSRSCIAQNLLTNGDFANGNTGFSTGYVYDASSVMFEGFYSIASNPNQVHPYAASFGDHTTGSGLMLVANGARDPGVVVWQELVNVDPNRTYDLSAWLAGWSGPDSLARLDFRIDGVSLGSLSADATAGAWTQFVAKWQSGAGAQASISIVDLNTDPGGNDFALDDLRFSLHPDVTPIPELPSAVTFALLVVPLVGAALRLRWRHGWRSTHGAGIRTA